MPKLVCRAKCRLYDVSEKLNKKGLYKLLPFKNKVFNEEFDESEIENKLTELANNLYCHETQSPYGTSWFLLDFDTDPTEIETVRIKIDYDNILEIKNIFDIIDVLDGCSQFFIVVNPARTEYRWIVASIYLVYTGED